MEPVIKPVNAPSAIAANIDIKVEQPRSFAKIDEIIPASATFEPTERSIPPVMITKVIPTATIPPTADCCNKLKKFYHVKNLGLKITAIRTKNKSSINKLYFLIKSTKLIFFIVFILYPPGDSAFLYFCRIQFMCRKSFYQLAFIHDADGRSNRQ